MRAAVYIRTSTDRQHGENQERDVLDLCARQGWEPFTFAEVASGAKDRRVWNDVIRRAVRGEFGAVASWALDRMGRDLYGITDSVRALDAAGVEVATVQEPWLMAAAAMGPGVRALLVTQWAWVADFERRRIVERIQAGLERARRNGKTLGRRPALDDGTAAEACQMRAEGASWKAIARTLNDRGHRTTRGKPISHGTVQTVVARILSTTEGN